jgi:hypothetical protein
MKTIEKLTTEVAIQKLSEHFKITPLKVDVREERTYFNVNIPHQGYGGLTFLSRISPTTIQIDQWTDYTSVMMVVDNSEIEAL